MLRIQYQLTVWHSSSDSLIRRNTTGHDSWWKRDCRRCFSCSGHVSDSVDRNHIIASD